MVPRLYKKGGLAARLISFHSTMEFITTTKRKPALILESGAKDKQSLGRLALSSEQASKKKTSKPV